MAPKPVGTAAPYCEKYSGVVAPVLVLRATREYGPPELSPPGGQATTLTAMDASATRAVSMLAMDVLET
jgi:hypothetical protein